jgi:hypothetical protein
MAINIQNIIDQITAKAAAADSTDTADYLLTLSKAVLAMNNATGVIEYRAKSQLPTVDSSILGNFAYIAAGYDIDSVYADSYAGFYYAARIGSNDSGWDRIRTVKDYNAENVFQGSISGYASGGVNPTPAVINTIEKYSFTSDANATDVGDLLTILRDPSGQSSSTHGYVTGGDNGTTSNVIQKYPFAVDANSADVGDLTQVRREMAGASSNANGYASGGNAPTPIGLESNIIDKFPFSVDANATDVGDLTVQRRYVTAGQSSSTHGYASGGQEGPANADTSTIIDKFPFASDASATDVGDLIEQVRQAMGQNSASHGYHSGGRVYSPVPASFTTSGVIQKFSFSTDGNASDVGDLTLVRFVASGSSSTSSGYTAGGGSPAAQNIIDKFPFASDANATDVGDLTITKIYLSGQQV